ncbi:MAG: HEAT repeat domain-containing protein [Euryarchaeota archaeon]|nr:HEAT repeat domain-containing protein [Euryarchaeota archaeon]
MLDQAEIHRQTKDEDSDVRWQAAIALGAAFSHVPDKTLAWQDLHRLTKDEDSDVRWQAAIALGVAFSHVPDKTLAWQDLHRLTKDEESYVRMYAYHSLGRASVFKATEFDDKDTMKKELEAAVKFFEKSSQEDNYSPSRFCYPFYRSYFAITFQDAREDEVQRYLTEAKNAVRGSETRDVLLQAVENLAGALRESQRLKDRPIQEIISDLNAYRWYCDKAGEYMAVAEDKASGAVKLLRRGNSMLEERIQSTIREIQDLARQICQVTASKGPGAEEFCNQIKDSARSLSTEDFNETLKAISDLCSILMEKTVLLPEGEKDLVKSHLDDVAKTGPVPEKLDKLKNLINFYFSKMKNNKEIYEKLDEIHKEVNALKESLLNRFNSSERKILSATFERLDKDKLEIVKEIIDAAEKDMIPKELIEETLKATEDLITEIKSAQDEIRDPVIASWDEALNSPELEIANRLKFSIPIIPLFLTYEGSCNFKSGLKLDKAWNKLRTLGRAEDQLR